MDAEMPIRQEAVHPGSIPLSLTPQQFYQGDPWLVFVKDKLKLNTSLNTAIFFVSSAAYDFSVTAIYQYYRPGVLQLDPFHQLLMLLFLPIASTIGYLIYLLLPVIIAETFNTLRENGVIGTSRQISSQYVSYESFVKTLLLWVNSRWWLVIIALITALYGLQRIFIQPVPIPLFWAVFGFIFGALTAIYVVCFILIRMLLLLVFLNRLFSLFTIQVKSLHSDGSGGLGSLGYFLWVGVGMTCASSLAVLAAPQAFAASPVYLILLTVSYLISILALVMGWLALPHYIMLQARKALLQPLTDEYEQVLKETLAAITDDTATIEAGSKRLLALQDRYKLLRDTFPVWPLEMMQMRRLVIAFILPVLLSLLPSVLDWFTKK